LKDRDDFLVRIKKLEDRESHWEKELERLRNQLGEFNERLSLAFTSTLDNNDKIEQLRDSLDKIDRGIKKYLDTMSKEMRNRDQTGELAAKITQEVKNSLGSLNPDQSLKEIRDEINALKVRNKCEEITIANIRDLAVGVKHKLEQSQIVDPNISSTNMNLRVGNHNRANTLEPSLLQPTNPLFMNTEVINPDRLNASSEDYLNLTRNNSVLAQVAR
jgi:predicted  nucleic acid-binding Zn-ribbon protein